MALAGSRVDRVPKLILCSQPSGSSERLEHDVHYQPYVVTVKPRHAHPGPPPRNEDHQVKARADPEAFRKLPSEGTVTKTSVLESSRLPKHLGSYREERGARIRFLCYPVDERIQDVEHSEFDLRPKGGIIWIRGTVDPSQFRIFLEFGCGRT